MMHHIASGSNRTLPVAPASLGPPPLLKEKQLTLFHAVLEIELALEHADFADQLCVLAAQRKFAVVLPLQRLARAVGNRRVGLVLALLQAAVLVQLQHLDLVHELLLFLFPVLFFGLQFLFRGIEALLGVRALLLPLLATLFFHLSQRVVALLFQPLLLALHLPPELLLPLLQLSNALGLDSQFFVLHFFPLCLFFRHSSLQFRHARASFFLDRFQFLPESPLHFFQFPLPLLFHFRDLITERLFVLRPQRIRYSLAFLKSRSFHSLAQLLLRFVHQAPFLLRKPPLRFAHSGGALRGQLLDFLFLVRQLYHQGGLLVLDVGELPRELGLFLFQLLALALVLLVPLLLH
mmetsp:Transcript_19721/g.49539  ORF Transcript_19721/g.49539 Transcript_19721/m.49539 type:complete len:349 (+) Transcript_19721:2843-3889(+)